jgi:hypothetical protein
MFISGLTLVKFKRDKKLNGGGIYLCLRKRAEAFDQSSWAGRPNRADPYFEILDH